MRLIKSKEAETVMLKIIHLNTHKELRESSDLISISILLYHPISKNIQRWVYHDQHFRSPFTRGKYSEGISFRWSFYGLFSRLCFYSYV